MYKRFYNFNLSDETLQALSEMGFESPTPIQEIAIPKAMEGLDIIGQAQTGTGKTAAFGIPIIEKGKRGRRPYALILAPTRELAVQVAQELNRMARNKGLMTVPIYGGQSIDRQIRALKKGVDIVVGTPGRIIDHIKRKTLVLKDVRIVVLDEADEMLNMGFIDDIEQILKQTPNDRQTMLFSATMPQEILRIAKRYMKNPEKVAVDAKDIVVSKIKQVFYEVREEDKIHALTRLLDVEDPSLALVFCHTKREVDAVASKLQQMGYYAGAIHGDYTQAHRDEMMEKFKKGDIEILVATDVAARGLDIPDVSHVVNYSIPQNPDSYVHRVGRTGRAGKSGIAITFVTPREFRQLKLIERSAKTRIKKAKLPTKDEVLEARRQDLMEELRYQIEEGAHESYLSMVDALSEEHSLRDIAAAALSLVSADMDIDEIEEIGAKDAAVSDHYVRLFMTVGRKDGVKVPDIVKSIANAADIPGRKIGRISLHDSFSFVEVPQNLAEKVITAINDSFLNGRKVKVQPAKPRRDKAYSQRASA